MNNIKDIIGENYLKKYNFYSSQTLFPPAWENLIEGRCPLCFNKVRVNHKRKMVYCRSAKHAKPFIMRLQKFQEIVDRLFNKNQTGV